MPKLHGVEAAGLTAAAGDKILAAIKKDLGLAHSNQQKAEIFESWENSGLMGFIWADFLVYAREAVDTLKYIRGLNQGLMDHLEVHGLTLEIAPCSAERISVINVGVRFCSRLKALMNLERPSARGQDS